ncbi:hypothetical protein Avbf_05531 [Armadillidium vulgare]|nr:hypothetical protein Avbf_05531 [Armadillidium vulgare]
MNAAALIVLILALIGIGMIGYYAMICLQIRHPKRRKLPRNSDMGPLLNNEDFNGNHEEPIIAEEDRPSELPEASAPKPEENDDQASKNEDLEIPVKSVSFQNTPECASIKPSSKEESIALDIDEEPPVLDNSKSVLHPSHDRVLGLKTSPVTLQKSHNEAPPHFIAENETHYNAMSDSYEEDGLLVPGSQHKSLLKEPRKRLHAQRSAPPEGYVPPSTVTCSEEYAAASKACTVCRSSNHGGIHNSS